MKKTKQVLSQTFSFAVVMLLVLSSLPVVVGQTGDDGEGSIFEQPGTGEIKSKYDGAYFIAEDEHGAKTVIHTRYDSSQKMYVWYDVTGSKSKNTGLTMTEGIIADSMKKSTTRAIPPWQLISSADYQKGMTETGFNFYYLTNPAGAVKPAEVHQFDNKFFKNGGALFQTRWNGAINSYEMFNVNSEGKTISESTGTVDSDVTLNSLLNDKTFERIIITAFPVASASSSTAVSSSVSDPFVGREFSVKDLPTGIRIISGSAKEGYVFEDLDPEDGRKSDISADKLNKFISDGFWTPVASASPSVVLPSVFGASGSDTATSGSLVGYVFDVKGHFNGVRVTAYKGAEYYNGGWYVVQDLEDGETRNMHAVDILGNVVDGNWEESSVSFASATPVASPVFENTYWSSPDGSYFFIKQDKTNSKIYYKYKVDSAGKIADTAQGASDLGALAKAYGNGLLTPVTIGAPVAPASPSVAGSASSSSSSSWTASEEADYLAWLDEEEAIAKEAIKSGSS
ncbi:MAG: hypothetical protein Q7K43_00705, partial [Candidatus Woesearchaeota archaeon]|nr:hypothetical protein [Candidatus Woesearchaeota archaeon]